MAKGPILMSWGQLLFDVVEHNIHEYDQVTQSDFARKDVAGAPPPREWTGEGDDELYLRGRVFPIRLGGLTEQGVLDQMRRSGAAHPMIRGGNTVGSGAMLGWYICQQYVRNSTFLDERGRGKKIEFEGVFIRVPTPGPAGWLFDFFANLARA